MKDSAPTASVIVPCRNEATWIESYLQSILAQEPPLGGYEVIVADGMSNDGTREILTRLAEKMPHLRIIDNPGRIVSTALNTAIRAARGQIIIRMDAHTEYATDYIRRCVAVLREAGADNVGGPWVARGKGYVSRAIAAAFQSPFSAGGARSHDPDYEGPVDTVYLGCWPRQVFDWVGLFDEQLVRNQDDEFNLRINRAGGKLWQSPRIRSWYQPRNSVTALLRQYVQYGYWKVRVIQKHRMPASVRHLVPGAFILGLVVLPLLSVGLPPLIWGWLGIVAMYILCNAVISLLTAARQGWELVFLLPVVFASYHFGYGYGFLRGVWDFIILKRGPRHAYTELTRTTAGDRS